ncbi:hypothetical protein BH20ACI1_BH20ACI1_13030 [soil metagenome]
MFLFGRKQFALLLFPCLLFVCSLTVFAQDKDWREVSSAELAMKTPVVDSDADAEAIFWDVRIDDSSSDDLSRSHYVRVKIFTERGREKYSKFDIPFYKGLKIKDLSARVIKPDGSITEIKKEDIFEREIIKAGGIKIKAKSFAVPNIEPGVIVEYRYREAINDAGAKGMHLDFQRDIPVQTLSYYYKPYNKREPDYQSYNFTDTKFVKDDKGFYLARRTNVPSFKEEPLMPPEETVRPWMLLQGTSISLVNASAFSLSFTIKDPSSPSRYWGGVGAEQSVLVKFMNKPNGDIKKAATEITASASTPEEKLRKLYEFCRTQIKNTSFDASLTDDDRKKLPSTKSLNDVLKRKQASAQYIDLLFGAMANSLGLETRVVFAADRSKMLFDPNMTNESFIHPAAIAVQVGNDWKYFNPGVSFLPYGMLVWYEEDVWALLVGEKNFSWMKTPLSGTDKTVAKRTGKFNLLEDGTLEGTVRQEYSGHLGLDYRLDNYDESADTLENNIKEEIKERVSTAEVSNISIENLNEPGKPFAYTYKVRIPNYAQKTGKRLFLQPGFFEYGENPVFSSASRKYDIYFHYPWAEQDSIEIKLPKGFDLDSADQPGEINDPQKISLLNVDIKIDRASNTLIYERKFYFGNGGFTLFPVGAYKSLKNLFDEFHKADTHTITLKQN